MSIDESIFDRKVPTQDVVYRLYSTVLREDDVRFKILLYDLPFPTLTDAHKRMIERIFEVIGSSFVLYEKHTGGYQIVGLSPISEENWKWALEDLQREFPPFDGKVLELDVKGFWLASPNVPVIGNLYQLFIDRMGLAMWCSRPIPIARHSYKLFISTSGAPIIETRLYCKTCNLFMGEDETGMSFLRLKHSRHDTFWADPVTGKTYLPIKWW